MIKERNIKRIKSGLWFFFIGILIAGCNDERRDFFQKMNPVKDIKIDSNSYFIKSFSLSHRPTKINGGQYWLLSSSNSSYFCLSGYLRKEKGTIWIVPVINNGKEFLETKLFDFHAVIGHSWKSVSEVRQNGARSGDLITLKQIRKSPKDTVYTYELRPYFQFTETRYNDKIFVIDVSKDYGIISITQLSPFGQLMYKAIFYPEQKFVNRVPPEFFPI
jgi:hypothetical protein